MSTTTDTTTTTTTHRDGCRYAALEPHTCPSCDGIAAPQCPAWCALPADEHGVVLGDAGGVAYTHARQTSDDDAPYLVRVEWTEPVAGPADWPTAPVVYIVDAHGDDLTPGQARGMAAALTAAADLLE